MSEYRVQLDIYNGPLDLLLYLIRRDELDVYDIPIRRILDQYLEYVELIKRLDPNLAGDFLVMAATLMEIKTRMLLPAPETDEDDPAGEQYDPRSELVRQLLEYKAFKDAAEDLGDAAEQRSMRYARRPVLPETGPPELELEEIQIWDLVDAFNGVLEAIGQSDRRHEVIYDDTPLEMHAEDICDRLRREGPLTFRAIFSGRKGRSEVIGLFLAMLELIRQKRVFAGQDKNFGEIHLVSREAEAEQEPPEAQPPREGEEPTVPTAEGPAHAPPESSPPNPHPSQPASPDSPAPGPAAQTPEE